MENEDGSDMPQVQERGHPENYDGCVGFRAVWKDSAIWRGLRVQHLDSRGIRIFRNCFRDCVWIVQRVPRILCFCGHIGCGLLREEVGEGEDAVEVCRSLRQHETERLSVQALRASVHPSGVSAGAKGANRVRISGLLLSAIGDASNEI